MEVHHPTLATNCASLALPEVLPVMILSECWLFPGCMLPLYIFEERYRKMLQVALDTHRMFCIGTRIDSEEGGILPVSTAGVVNACVKHPDGTSSLVLLGTKRIRLIEWVGDEPYRMARVEPMETDPHCHQSVATLREEVMQSLPPCPADPDHSIAELCARLRTTDNCEFVCDVLTYHFVRDPEVLNASLVEPNLEKRYRMLLDELRK